MSIESMNESLYTRLIEVTDVTRSLPGLLARHEGVGVDGAEGVNDDFAADRLDGIDHDSYCAGMQLLE